jgi:hypothetical protein
VKINLVQIFIKLIIGIKGALTKTVFEDKDNRHGSIVSDQIGIIRVFTVTVGWLRLLILFVLIISIIIGRTVGIFKVVRVVRVFIYFQTWRNIVMFGILLFGYVIVIDMFLGLIRGVTIIIVARRGCPISGVRLVRWTVVRVMLLYPTPRPV